jgi:hypothetical protein
VSSKKCQDLKNLGIILAAGKLGRSENFKMNETVKYFEGQDKFQD